jgi:hypothetical protein
MIMLSLQSIRYPTAEQKRFYIESGLLNGLLKLQCHTVRCTSFEGGGLGF